MASSLSTKQFLGSPSSDFGSLQRSDLRNLSSPTLHFSNLRSHPKKLEIQAVGSTFGTYFRVSTYGESHGGGVGCIIDGCPPRVPLSEADMQVDLDRRRPGQSRITTPRKETDTCEIYSGVAEGMTTGSPIMVKVPNTDQRGHDYSEMSISYRPSHADAAYDFKYGVRSVQGGGRSSARETIGRVAAGAVAKKILKLFSGTEILAYVSQVHKVILPEDFVDHESLSLDEVTPQPNPPSPERIVVTVPPSTGNASEAGSALKNLEIITHLLSHEFLRSKSTNNRYVLKINFLLLRWASFAFGRGFFISISLH